MISARTIVISSKMIYSTSEINFRCSFLYLKNSKIRPFFRLKSGSSGNIGRKGNLKKEWSVTPSALIAAIPVGANTTYFFFVCAQMYFKNVDLPVPAFPVKKTDWRVWVISCRASWNSLLFVSNWKSKYIIFRWDKAMKIFTDHSNNIPQNICQSP